MLEFGYGYLCGNLYIMLEYRIVFVSVSPKGAVDIYCMVCFAFAILGSFLGPF